MVSKLGKEDHSDRFHQEQKPGVLPADSTEKSASGEPGSESLAAPSQPAGPDDSRPIGDASRACETPQPSADAAGTRTAEGASLPQASRLRPCNPAREAAREAERAEEAEVLGEVLDLLRAVAPLRAADAAADDDFAGLTVDVGPLVGCGDESDDERLDPPAAREPQSAPESASETASQRNVDGFPRPRKPRKGKRLAKPSETGKTIVTPEQRLLLLDTWRRSGLSAGDFAALVGVSKHTLYKWKQLFADHGPQGLMDQPRKRLRSDRIPELTRRAILMMKEANPDWGCQRISDMLARGPALPASASSVAKVLKEAGYETVELPTRNHPQRPRRFERAKPNQLWQTDLFSFVLKRQNRRLYLVAFLDDHSRFLVSFGLSPSATTAHVIEILEAGVASFGPPEEVLTDNGPQYVTWRGKSRFTRHLEKRGIRQIVARPKRPQTLGKIERFWGTLWREFLEEAVFADLEDARRRIAFFIDYYNFSRVHRGIDGLTPADRFFHAAPDMLRMLKERVSANALELARHGAAKKPFYVTGQVDGQSFSVHSEGERLILRRQDGQREEVELTSPPATAEPGTDVSPLCADGSLPAAPGDPANQQPPPPGQSVIALPAPSRPPAPAEQAPAEETPAEQAPAEQESGDAAKGGEA